MSVLKPKQIGIINMKIKLKCKLDYNDGYIQYKAGDIVEIDLGTGYVYGVNKTGQHVNIYSSSFDLYEEKPAEQGVKIIGFNDFFGGQEVKTIDFK